MPQDSPPNQSNPTALFQRQDVEAWLGRGEVAKGEGYLDQVSELEIGETLLTARVQGTRPKPYRVDIRFHEDGRGGWRPGFHCSCPVGGHCKHAAAVLLRTLEERERPDQIRPEVLNWVHELRRLADTPKSGRKAKATPSSRLFYLLSGPDGRNEYRVKCVKARTDALGRPSGALQGWTGVERALVNPPQFVDEDDLAILRLLWSPRHRHLYSDALPLDPRTGDEVLRKLLACGRWLMDRDSRLPWRLGAERGASLAWRQDALGRMHARMVSQPEAARTVPLDPPWYLDAVAGEAGPLALNVPAPLLRQLLTGPSLSHAEAQVLAATLAEIAPELPSPTGHSESLRVIDAPARPLLQVATVPIFGLAGYRDYSDTWERRQFDFAVPFFQFADQRLACDDKRDFLTLENGETVRLKRDSQHETALLKSLLQMGFTPIPSHAVYAGRPLPRPCYGLACEAAWEDFMADTLPALKAAGWEVELPADFRHDYLDVEEWHAEVAESAPGWFDLSMGIVVDGRRLALAPLLAGLFSREPRWLDAKSVEAIPDKAWVALDGPDGRRIRLPAERLKPVARTLIDLFEGGIGHDGSLRVARLDAPRLAELADLGRWQFRGLDAVRQLAERLLHSHGVKAVATPEGFALELRPYQQEGLAWLQYLREQDLSGILADDMGLGKTAQTLAHLLTEKAAGRLDKPALVVLPTSLIFNWKHEAARFAPGLKVLSLHGKERHGQFERLADHDVALTTYPLLWRDHEILEKQEYHMLILDEAQTVKNAGSQAAQVVRKLRARHRLCLTGTPLENHLGELWAQFDFLLPGFLGDNKSFTRIWRNPIEKHGDVGRRDLLARRLRPFILRRRKEEVARELPPKTLILRTVELEGGQRDLYETVRSAMDARVREAIADLGFQRSQIVILDALLKLRQVCCDPRLLKSETARSVKERAKLDLLMDLLPEMVEEGRRILLFSQFTSMLDLIRKELDQAGLTYLLLTGDTVDRETPIRRFQAGEVPIFLISLKAGGMGLNLTAADTVIHYDPWWNPAVENQATDRAHRLGQTKPVFVYKLIVAGSIEEKILALQERKAELAAGILAEDHQGEVKFGESDLAALLAPLP
ncbi:MAG: DEAD/DEAH box helicase [Pseudomonadota bacterium]